MIHMNISKILEKKIVTICRMNLKENKFAVNTWTVILYYL